MSSKVAALEPEDGEMVIHLRALNPRPPSAIDPEDLLGKITGGAGENVL